MEGLIRRIRPAASLLGVIVTAAMMAGDTARTGPYAQWRNGPPNDPSFFPIAVWLQSPSKAQAYLKAGVNTYVGLWRGPTESQLATLKQAGLKVVCKFNDVARRHLDDPTIVGWMHGDEPDNAQSLPNGQGYGPPIPPERIIQDHQKLKNEDPTRPVLLNLGQGVAWDGWHGRGVRTNHPKDYPEYCKGGDIVSFDIYPVVHDRPQVSGKLWYVATGVERLVKWTEGLKPVWNCLECTRISHPTAKPTPQQVRAEAWMAIIHGSRGLIWFVHEWKPKFNESALLDDPEMLDAVTRINREVRGLALAINSPPITDSVTVNSSNSTVPIAWTARPHGGHLYLFAVAMRPDETMVDFAIKGLAETGSVDVLGENRQINLQNGRFTDRFAEWDVHLYKIAAPPSPR
ncbi:MAG: hypothetical protein ACP5MD_00575 [Verrucomicrobiia bacterium]